MLGSAYNARRLNSGLDMHPIVKQLMFWQLLFAGTTALVLLVMIGWQAALASLAAAAAVISGSWLAGRRMFLAKPGDGPGEILRAFNRAMVLKWVTTLALFAIAVMMYSSQPAALALGFTVTVLSFVPAMFFANR